MSFCLHCYYFLIIISVTNDNAPIITQCSAFLANIERTGKKGELYRFMTDSSEPNSSYVDMLWLSEKDYNYVNAYFKAIYVPEEEYDLPDYVESYKLGIVRAKMQIDLHKVDRKGMHFIHKFDIQ